MIFAPKGQLHPKRDNFTPRGQLHPKGTTSPQRDKFTPRGQILPKGTTSPQRDNFSKGTTSPKRDNFTHRGQFHPFGLKLAPRGEIKTRPLPSFQIAKNTNPFFFREFLDAYNSKENGPEDHNGGQALINVEDNKEEALPLHA
jgi:hypothetical protein